MSVFQMSDGPVTTTKRVLSLSERFTLGSECRFRLVSLYYYD